VGSSKPNMIPHLSRAVGADGYGWPKRRIGSASRYGERQMYPAVCAQCGKDPQVPFQPRGDKPVYCSDCYRAQQGSGRPPVQDPSHSCSLP
jgi:CxxC-x17-CxxC domain-containing protein